MQSRLVCLAIPQEVDLLLSLVLRYQTFNNLDEFWLIFIFQARM